MTFDEIRKLIDAATPGPWRYAQLLGGIEARALIDCRGYHFGQSDDIENGLFIAASRQLLPLLLDVAEAADDVNANQYHTPDDDCRLCAASHRLQQALAKLKELKL